MLLQPFRVPFHSQTSTRVSIWTRDEQKYLEMNSPACSQVSVFLSVGQWNMCRARKPKFIVESEECNFRGVEPNELSAS